MSVAPAVSSTCFARAMPWAIILRLLSLSV